MREEQDLLIKIKNLIVNSEESMENIMKMLHVIEVTEDFFRMLEEDEDFFRRFRFGSTF